LGFWSMCLIELFYLEFHFVRVGILRGRSRHREFSMHGVRSLAPSREDFLFKKKGERTRKSNLEKIPACGHSTRVALLESLSPLRTPPE
jgi:hypothetical protein